MSEVPLLEMNEEPFPPEEDTASRHLPSLFLRDEFDRPLTPYLRQKATGERRESGALNLKKLSQKHLRIIEMHIAGWSGGAIAHQMNLTQNRVSLILSDPLAKNIISQSHEDVKGEIRALTKHSVNVVRDVLLNDKATVTNQFKAIDKLKTLHEMTGGEERAATAEDLVQQILASGSTINVQVNNNVETKDANEQRPGRDISGDYRSSSE